VGKLDAEIGLVICNKKPEEAGIYDRIDKLNKHYRLDIETAYISRHTHPQGGNRRGQTLAESEAILERFEDARISHVSLLGYMVIVRGALLDAYGWHPQYTSI
jgi:folate-dependent phosphoribosylglycinamide formyltransferase PurN